MTTETPEKEQKYEAIHGVPNWPACRPSWSWGPAARGAGPDRDAALHETRKAAKRARYAAEAAGPVLGKKARRFARRMKKVQPVLGDHQDAVNARALARDLGVEANLAGESAFSFGTLYDLADHEARECQREARRAWKRVSRKRS